MSVKIVIDGTEVEVDERDVHLLSAYDWKVRGVGTPSPSGSTSRLRLVWYEMTRTAEGKRRLITHQFHREMFPSHEGHISFANSNPFDLRRENILLHESVVNKVSCPFTVGRLDELYWKHGWSAYRVGEAASLLLNRPIPINQDTVLGWLRSAGVVIRSRTTMMRIRHRRDPHLFRRWRLKGVAISAQKRRDGINPTFVERFHTGPMKRKARQRRQRAFEEKLVTQKCRRPACRVYIKRSPAQIARKNEVYCSRRCSGLDRQRVACVGKESIPEWLKTAMESRT